MLAKVLVLFLSNEFILNLCSQSTLSFLMYNNNALLANKICLEGKGESECVEFIKYFHEYF